MAQPTFVASSKRALSSTSTATCTPRSAARIRLRAIGLSPPARYSVILIALHPRVVGRLGDEVLDAAGEALVRVVDHQRPLADDGEDAAPRLVGLGDAPGGDRRPRLVLQLGPVEAVQLPQAGEVDQPAVAGHVALVELQLADEQLEHLLADRVLHLEAHRAAEAAAAQLHLHRGEQVVGVLVLDGEVGVAGDAEHGVLLDDHADEHRVQLRGDDLLDRHEPLAVGQGDQPREHRRHLDPGEAALAGVRVADHRGQVQREVGDVRERVRRIDGQRREHREDPLVVDADEELAVVDAELVPRAHLDAALGQRRQQPIVDQRLLLGHEVRRGVGDLERAAAPAVSPSGAGPTIPPAT